MYAMVSCGMELGGFLVACARDFLGVVPRILKFLYRLLVCASVGWNILMLLGFLVACFQVASMSSEVGEAFRGGHCGG